MIPTLSLDLETRSALDVTKVGAHRYFEHPSTEILLGSWAIDDGPIRRWRAGEHVPAEIMFHVEQGGLIAGWNVAFERLAWAARLSISHDWPMPAPAQFHDTAALAAAMALPRALEDCADALNLAVGKDLEGSLLMKKMSRPRKPRKGEDKERIYWFEDDERMSRLAQYCDRDVEVEREIRRRLFKLSSFERDVWLLDQKINDRGIAIDLELMRAMDALAHDEQERLDAALAEVTDGAIRSCNQTVALTKWLRDQGVDVPSLKHQTFDELLAQKMPPPCRAALLLRQESAKSSTKKLQAAKRATGTDGRMRGTLLYHGASTGRWSGKLLQPQNLPRPQIVKNILPVVELIRHGNAELIRWLYGNVLTPLSDCLRGLIVAEPGHELLSFDYSNIEARLTAWIAGDTAKLARFAEIDADPTLPDMYRVAAAGIYNVTPADIPKSDPRRQVGKVAELACLGADTLVLTDSGWKPIIKVTRKDRVWDGVEWVQHRGLVARGVKPVVDVDGIKVTADHLIRIPGTWLPAQRLATNGSILSRALALGSASLPSSATSMNPKAESPMSLLNALAERNHIASQFTIFAAAPRPAAIHARRSSPTTGEKISLVTLISCRMTGTEGVCSTVFQPALRGATHRTIRNMRTMAVAASTSLKRGATAFPAGELSSPISRRCQVGMIRNWSLTGSTSIRATSLAIYGSPRAARTCSTNDPSRRCSVASANWKPVFDLVDVGPRNRFTVRTKTGCLIVHNCGFGGGVGALLQMGANYHVDMGLALPPLRETCTTERWEQVLDRWEQTVKRKNDRGIPRDAWLAAELTKRAWRDANPKIVEAWHMADNAAWEAVGEPGKTVGNEIPLRFLRKNGFLWMQLPSGRPLAYGDPRVRDVEVPWSDKTVARPARETKRAVTVMSTERPKGGMPGFIRYPLYPGLEIQHAVQATARDLLAAGMLRADAAGYRLVLSVHDEALAEERIGARDLDEFVALMCELPGWAHGLPVVGDAWRGPRYHKHD